MEIEGEGKEIHNYLIKVSYEAKLKELLRNVTSIELQLCSEASKEFMKLLRGEEGGEMLRQYIQSSCDCSELLQAWNLRQSRPGLSYIMSLISVILSHEDGVYRANDATRLSVSRALDKLARLILEQNMDDVYKELNSKEGKGKNAALLLMASIVRRGSGLASDVAKSFDFKLPAFLKLAEYDKRRRNVEKTKRRSSTRKSFVRFAMSFLEVEEPRLLRWVLQQKEMFSAVLRGLGNDEEETIVYVLSTLRDRVLIPDSLVPVGLRSVLFGSVTLEQLVNISGWDDGGVATEIAKKVLFMVCTDPSNGLMPDAKALPTPLKGNPTRLLGVMKKLKATEIDFHRDLILAVVRGRPSFGSAYLDEFPYNLDNQATWFAAVFLAANLISSVNAGLSFDFLDCRSHEPPSFNSSEVQNIIKCIVPRSFTRIVMNKGLLHSESLVKHGTLRFVLEALKLLDSLFSALNHRSNSSKQIGCKWSSLKQDIQNEVKLLLPDHQVLLSLISSLNVHHKGDEKSSKRAANAEVFLEHCSSSKKLKTSSSNEEADILVGGVSTSMDAELTADNGRIQEVDNVNDSENLKGHALAELWGLHESNNSDLAVEDEETCFYSKLLDTLIFYHRTMPSVVEGSFDFFKILPSNVLTLPTTLQKSLLSLLVEHIGWSSKHESPMRCPPLMYKHLMQFINLVINSSVREIRDQAYVLAHAAMLSTGAFDNNTREIDAWFLFIPGFSSELFGAMVTETIQSLSSAIVSFFCDVVSTIGNNLFKYWDLLRFHIHHLEGIKDVYPHFSPLFICVLEKCLRLIGSESGTFSLSEKSLVSVYVSNTLRYLLQTQVGAELLSSLICLLLSGRLADVDLSGNSCEWRPLKSLLCFSRCITDKQSCTSIDRNLRLSDDSFVNLLGQVKHMVKNGHKSEISTAFSFSVLCAAPDLILQHFPEVISVSQNLHGVPFSILLYILYLERGFLKDVFKLWPELSFSALERVDALIHGEDKSKEMNDCSVDSAICASVAFSSFLDWAPFYVLFPAIINVECLYLVESSKLQDLLLAKLSKEMSDNFVSSFCLVLFWFHCIQSSYRHEATDEHVQLSGICFTLLNSMLSQLPAGNNCAQEVAEIIFSHPALAATLESPLFSDNDEELKASIFCQSKENFLCLARKGAHTMDSHVLKLLQTLSTHLSTFGSELKFSSEVHASKRITRVFKSFLQKLVLMLKDRFEQFIESNDPMLLIPSLLALHNLIHLISPLELLELACWMFSRFDLNESPVLESPKTFALSAGLNIAGCAFDLLPCYVQQPHAKQVPSCFSGTVDKVYSDVVEIASRFELAIADLCLLKAVKVANAPKDIKTESLPLCMFMSRTVARTPLKLLSRCIQRTSMTKARLLFHITESSLLHLSVFGHLFMEMVNKSLVSDEDLILLLPTALSYLNSFSMRYGQKSNKQIRSIPSLYGEILLDGFSNWKSYVSMDLFRVELGELLPLSLDNLLDFFDNSLLGRAIAVLRHYLSISGASVKPKKRLKLFDSVLPSGTDNLLDCDVREIDAYSLDQSLNLINKLVSKIHLCKMLLFPGEKAIQEVDGDIKDSSSEVKSNKVYLRRVLFVNTLVFTWQLIVKRFPSKSNGCSEVDASKCALFRHLEKFIFGIIMELTAEMHKNSVIKSNSLAYPEELARSCLLHRVEDSATLSMLRGFLTLVPEDKSLHIQVLQLLLAHSQFASTIQSASSSSCSLQFGVIVRPMSSILRSLTFASGDQNGVDKVSSSQSSEPHIKQLEVLKLLRVLHHTRARLSSLGTEQDIGINSRELLFLLLSSYGATFSERDLEIYNLMHELESTDESNTGFIADMDYLWGNSAIKVRKLRESEQAFSSDIMSDDEALEEHRRSHFRENLPIDPRVCASTVLYFPYDTITGSRALLSSSELPFDNAGQIRKAPPRNVERRQIYDPCFILRLSIHGLSMNYIEPVEYASLGLLAVACMSLSSPDDVIRKLAYKVLAIIKSASEINQKRKDIGRLHSLMSYACNGIGDQWPRIPSVNAVFIAEASVLLLDPSNDRCSTISKLIKNSMMNTKVIPFFENFFWSSSTNFKSDRIWMLRLLYAGLNLEDDAQIYVKNSILEKLLNFYGSPFSDDESRELILQIVKKAFKFDRTSRYMVERCGVISWLSSLVSNFCGGMYEEQSSVSSTELALILEVANDCIASRSIQWLQIHAPEQLTQLSSHLYMLLAGGCELVKGNFHLFRSVLEVLTTTLKMSQERDVFQSHFNLSVEGLFQLYQSIAVCCDLECSPIAELGLKVILMSTPQAAMLTMDQEKLQKFVLWAATTALRSNSSMALRSAEADNRVETCLEKERTQDSLISKLLRWLTASVILGRLSWLSGDVGSKHYLGRSPPETLQSLLDGNGSVNQVGCGSEELLAATIYYLQQILGCKCEVLTSVVTSLCLLLFPDSSNADVLPDRETTFASLLARIRCPAEANPSWKWSYDQPWKDPSSVDELQACQSLLLVISNALGKRSSLMQFLSYIDVENSGVFKWERNLVETE